MFFLVHKICSYLNNNKGHDENKAKIRQMIQMNQPDESAGESENLRRKRYGQTKESK